MISSRALFARQGGGGGWNLLPLVPQCLLVVSASAKVWFLISGAGQSILGRARGFVVDINSFWLGSCEMVVNNPNVELEYLQLFNT